MPDPYARPGARFLQRSPRRRRGKSCAATATDASHSQRPPPGQNAWRQFRKMRGPMAANPDQLDMENLVVDAGGLGASLMQSRQAPAGLLGVGFHGALHRGSRLGQVVQTHGRANGDARLECQKPGLRHGG